MIEYSPRAAKAIGFLKQAYNDIEIYVEDTANQNLWLKILKKMLPSHVKLTSITMLGGRDNVVSACSLDQLSDGRKRLYIIDGDFDFIRGRPKPRLKYLYRLRAYCVENLLLDEKALAEVACDASGNVTPSAASQLLAYHNVIGSHSDALKALFAVYAVAHDLHSGIRTVGLNVRSLLDSSPAAIVLSDDKIISRARSLLKELCKAYGTSLVRERRTLFHRRAQSLPIGMAVSGKDYLLPPLYLQMRRTCGYLGTEDQLKIQLAKEYVVSSEPYLHRTIRQISRM